MLSDKLHSNLVTKSALRQKPKLENKPGVSWNVPISKPGSLSSLTEPMKSEQTELLPALLKTQTIDTKSTKDTDKVPHLVKGTKMKERILKEYTDKYSGSHSKPIVTTKKVSLPSTLFVSQLNATNHPS